MQPKVNKSLFEPLLCFKPSTLTTRKPNQQTECWRSAPNVKTLDHSHLFLKLISEVKPLAWPFCKRTCLHTNSYNAPVRHMSRAVPLIKQTQYPNILKRTIWKKKKKSSKLDFWSYTDLLSCEHKLAPESLKEWLESDRGVDESQLSSAKQFKDRNQPSWHTTSAPLFHHHQHHLLQPKYSTVHICH